MEVTVDRAALLKELLLCKAVIETRNVVPALTFVHLEPHDGVLSLRATDLNLTLFTGVPLERSASAGTCAVDTQALLHIARSTDANLLTLEYTEGRLSVTCGMSSFKIPAIPGDDFPVAPDIEGATARTVDGADLAAVIRATAYAITDSEVEFGLRGIVLRFTPRTLRVYGSDRCRLAIAECPSVPGDAAEGLIPRKATAATLKVLDEAIHADVQFGERFIFLSSGNRTLAIRSDVYSLPNFDEHLANVKPRAQAAIGRDSLLASVKRCAVAAKYVTLNFTRGRLTMSAKSPKGEATDVIPVEFSGDDLQERFWCSYLIDALSSFESATVSAAIAPITLVLRPEGQNTGERVAVVMAMST